MKIQSVDQVVDQVWVVVTCGLVGAAVPIALGMNILKDFDLIRLLAK